MKLQDLPEKWKSTFFFMETVEKSNKKLFLEYITEYWHVIQKELIH